MLIQWHARSHLFSAACQLGPSGVEMPAHVLLCCLLTLLHVVGLRLDHRCLCAGMDMALAFIASLHGESTAEEAARFAEYSGNWRNGADDPWGRKTAPAHK